MYKDKNAFLVSFFFDTSSTVSITDGGGSLPQLNEKSISLTLYKDTINEIEEIIKNKKAIYDLKADKRSNKIGDGSKLEKYPLDKLPEYLQANLKYYEKWID